MLDRSAAAEFMVDKADRHVSDKKTVDKFGSGL
jgi:hypothetical protein